MNRIEALLPALSLQEELFARQKSTFGPFVDEKERPVP